MRIVIFGTGECGQKLLSRPLRENCCIVLVCDNNASKWDEYCYGYLIEKPDKINGIFYDRVVVATDKYAYDIQKQLLDMG